MDRLLIELAEEPGLWLPPEPKLAIVPAHGYSVVTFGRSAWVHRVRLEPESVDGAVEDVRALLRGHGFGEVTWWIGELSTPDGLASRLAQLGLDPDDPPELTSFTIATRPAGEPSIEVRRAQSFEDALAALEIDWESFDVPAAERETRRLEAAEAWPLLLADGRQSTYLAYLDGRPAGFARGVFTPNGGLLLGGATLPHARGRGVYTSLVHARWDEAVERGTPRLTVSAGPMSAPILSRLGFETIGRVLLLKDRL